MSQTPILDKFNLHPCGGYCTCFANPYSSCSICEAIRKLLLRWAIFLQKTGRKRMLNMTWSIRAPQTKMADDELIRKLNKLKHGRAKPPKE